MKTLKACASKDRWLKLNMASSRSGFAEDSDLEEVPDSRDKKPSATMKVCCSRMNVVIGRFVKCSYARTLWNAHSRPSERLVPGRN